MYTLKGVFPEPRKEHKKNFIKENMKQLKFMQTKSPTEPKYTIKSVHPPRLTHANAVGSSLGSVKSIPSNKNTKVSLNVGKASLTNTRKKHKDIKLNKGDMAEFLKRKELRHSKSPEPEEEIRSSESSGQLRDIACQTVESSLVQKLTDSTNLTMLYPKKENEECDAKIKASGDTGLQNQSGPQHTQRKSTDSSRRCGDELLESERRHSKLNSILERKDKDPYLPSGYQKGVLPKYLKERKDNSTKEIVGGKVDDGVCPPGHVALPDTERKETLRMLRNSFAELVNELNKLPVKTDTLRTRNRKMELEKQLAKLEEGIKVFSRPKVFVKIGE